MKPTYPAVGDGVTVRLACCIPHCRRTFRNDKKLTPWPEGMITMCGPHWRSGPPHLRLIDRKLRRLLRKVERMMPRRPKLAAYLSHRINLNWDRAQKAITERAMGIG